MGDLGDVAECVEYTNWNWSANGRAYPLSRFGAVATMKRDVMLDDVLLLFTFLDRLCRLHLWQVYDGRVCSNVKKIVDILIVVRMEVKEFLLEVLNKGNRYLIYAACKLLVSFGTLVSLATGSVSFIKDLDVCFSKTALEVNIEGTLGMLTVVEHFCLVKSEKRSTAVGFRANDHCSAIAVKSPMESTIDDVWLRTINHSSYSLMSKILSSKQALYKLPNWECISRILRILVIVASRDCHMQEFLAQYHVLLQLLHISSLVLLTDSCRIFHQILKCTLKSAATTSNLLQSKLTSDVLTLLIPLLDTFSADEQMVLKLRGFGGIVHLTERKTSWSYNEFQRDDHQAIQSVVLLYLSSVEFVSKDCLAASDEEVLLKRSILSLQTFCESMSSVSWSGSPSLRYSFYLVSLFDDQDDALVEALVYCLEIASQLKRNGCADGDIVCQMWNSHSDFYFLLRSIEMDYKVILDLLMSDDTLFLLYFVKYLKLASKDIEDVFIMHRALSRELSFNKPTDLIKMPFNRGETDRWLQPAKKIVYSDDRGLVDYDFSDDDALPDNESSYMEDMLALAPNTNVFDAKRMNLLPSLEQVIDVCNLLRLRIESLLHNNLFPYNAKPLLNLLQAFASRCGGSCREG